MQIRMRDSLPRDNLFTQWKASRLLSPLPTNLDVLMTRVQQLNFGGNGETMQSFLQIPRIISSRGVCCGSLCTYIVCAKLKRATTYMM